MYFVNSKNPLLVRDDVGKAKPSSYDLPGEQFAFGRAELADVEGAREVTMNWVSHKPHSREEDKGINFVALNKLAAKKNISLKLARKQMDGHVSPPKSHGLPLKVHPSDVCPTFTYGKHTRPSTPIASVISNQYAAEYEMAQEINYKQYEEEKQAVRAAPVAETKASVGHKIGAARRREEVLKKQSGEEKELFKMKKFQKVQSTMKHTDAYAALAARREAEKKAAIVSAPKSEASPKPDAPKHDEAAEILAERPAEA